MKKWIKEFFTYTEGISGERQDRNCRVGILLTALFGFAFIFYAAYNHNKNLFDNYAYNYSQKYVYSISASMTSFGLIHTHVGTGFLVHKRKGNEYVRLIITNAHVCDELSPRFNISASPIKPTNKTDVENEVTYTLTHRVVSHKADLCAILIDEARSLYGTKLDIDQSKRPFRLRFREELNPFEEVVAYGYTAKDHFKSSFGRYTGKVYGKGVHISNTDIWKLDIAQNVWPGMSGGPIFDKNGNLVGVTAASFMGIAGDARGVARPVPASEVIKFLNKLEL